MTDHFLLLIQDVLLALSAVFVLFYLWETRLLRIASQQQVAASQALLEAQIRPAVDVSILSAQHFSIRNIGNGPAINVRHSLRPYRGRVDWDPAPGPNQIIAGAGSMSAGAKVDFSLGQSLSAITMQILYQSLSGKIYVSLIDFDGSGSPIELRLDVK